jgi:hypothetical protein
MLLWDDQTGPCIERVIGFAEDTEGSFYPLTCTREAQGNWLAHGDPHGAANLVRLFHESEPHDKAQVAAWIEDHRKRAADERKPST